MTKIRRENKVVRYLIIVLALILALLYVINPDTRVPVVINLIFLGISFVVYSSKEYQDDLIGINPKRFFLYAFFGLLAGGAFVLATAFIPGLSIGYPILPNSVSESLRGFFVNFVSPLTETILFLGAIFAFLHNFDTKRKYTLWIIVGVSIFFALFHIGAYVAGFYEYPSFTDAFGAVSANISAFLVAFIFNMIVASIMVYTPMKDLVFGFFFHFVPNATTFFLSAVTFVFHLPLIR